ncbi:MAG: MgtC/SapB family protein [Lachnospiraceae bacterium]|nr:MgtC/SapB family protein [Lachnospiraceae bacterium]
MQNMWFPDYFRELNMFSLFLRFLICIICGGMIGIEREWRHRTAGFKTHILVCLGAAVCMMTGQYAMVYFDGGDIDPTRLGAQVISGIGFLGVGTIIIKNNNEVKGLTTAAGLWVSACIGLAVGIGFFEIAIVGTLCVVFLFLVMRQLNIFGVVKEANIHIYVEVEELSNIQELMHLMQEIQAEVYSMEKKYTIKREGRAIGIILSVRGEKSLEKELFKLIAKQDYVLAFSEIDN